jgi:hypothetical protein
MRRSQGAQVVGGGLRRQRGAIQQGIDKLTLGLFLGIGAPATAAIFFIHTGDWLLALVLFVIVELSVAVSVVVFFLVGGLLLGQVDVAQGRTAVVRKGEPINDKAPGGEFR